MQVANKGRTDIKATGGAIPGQYVPRAHGPMCFARANEMMSLLEHLLFTRVFEKGVNVPLSPTWPHNSWIDGDGEK